MGIKHRADSGLRKFRVFSKPRLGGQVRSSEMPYVSYSKPLPTIQKPSPSTSIFRLASRRVRLVDISTSALPILPL